MKQKIFIVLLIITFTTVLFTACGCNRDHDRTLDYNEQITQNETEIINGPQIETYSNLERHNRQLV